MDKLKIRAIFEYEFRCRTNASETARKINSVFEEGLASHSTVSFYFAKFHSGDLSFENEPRGRSQPEVNNDLLKAIVGKDTPQTTRQSALEFGVSIPTILDHSRQINKVKKFDRWVPHELNRHHIKDVSMLAFLRFPGLKESLFCIVLLLVVKNGCSMIIISVQQAG